MKRKEIIKKALALEAVPSPWSATHEGESEEEYSIRRVANYLRHKIADSYNPSLHKYFRACLDADLTGYRKAWHDLATREAKKIISNQDGEYTWAENEPDWIDFIKFPQATEEGAFTYDSSMALDWIKSSEDMIKESIKFDCEDGNITVTDSQDGEVIYLGKNEDDAKNAIDDYTKKLIDWSEFFNYYEISPDSEINYALEEQEAAFNRWQEREEYDYYFSEEESDDNE